MSALLTTRQVESLLQVDRTTVYRMLKDGRLRGIKVGNHWRFPQSEIDELLSFTPQETNPIETPIHDVLPLTCMQGMQNVSAEAMGISATITDTAGKPLTKTSNPCHFCQLIRSSNKGRAACQAHFARLAQQAKSRPHLTCHAGLQCTSAPITVNNRETAVFIANEHTFSPTLNNRQRHIQQVANTYELDSAALSIAASEFSAPNTHQQEKLAGWITRLTDTLSEIGQERADLLGRLQRIAHMSAVG